MKTMIIAATEAELAPLKGEFGDSLYVVGGIGASNMAVSLLEACREYGPDRVVQVGIAGAVREDLALCQGVIVRSDVQADLGAVRDGRFVRFEDQAPVIECPWVRSLIGMYGVDFECVRAASVNTACSGIYYGLDVDIETMEGAPFFKVMEQLCLPYLQLRTISNHINTPRPEWKIRQAIDSLECFTPLIKSFFR